MSLDDSFIGRFFGEKYDHPWVIGVILTIFVLGALFGLLVSAT